MVKTKSMDITKEALGEGLTNGQGDILSDGGISGEGLISKAGRYT